MRTVFGVVAALEKAMVGAGKVNVSVHPGVPNFTTGTQSPVAGIKLPSTPPTTTLLKLNRSLHEDDSMLAGSSVGRTLVLHDVNLIDGNVKLETSSRVAAIVALLTRDGTALGEPGARRGGRGREQAPRAGRRISRA